MKKKILFSAALLCMMVSFHSCDKLSNCQVCSMVKRDAQSGNVISQESEAEYCDAELIAIKAIAPITAGGVTTKWECR